MLLNRLSVLVGALVAIAATSLPASSATSRPQLIERIEPEYPAAMRDLAEDGSVRVSFLVTPEGRVVNVRIDRSSNPAFDECVRAALAQWRYEPARRDGTPVRSERLRETIEIPAPLDRRLAVLTGREVFVSLDGPVIEADELQVAPMLIQGAYANSRRSRADLEGKRIVVSFIIRSDGVPVNPSIAADTDPKIANHAFTPLLIARWKPPMHQGQPVHVRVTAEMGLIGRNEVGFVGPTSGITSRVLGTSAGLTSSEPELETTYALNELTSPPEPIRQPFPNFPLEMQKRGARGRVVVGFMVNRKGEVVDPYIVSATRPEFEEPVLEAVYRWRFRPGRVNGRPVNVRMQIPIEFNIVPSG